MSRLSARVFLLVALIASSAIPARAQEADRAGPAASVEAYLGLTRVAGLTSGSGGASATLHLADDFRLGGGFWGALRQIDEGPVVEGSGLVLGMGYGGLFVERAVPIARTAARLLVGGGAATLRNVATDTRFDTETFLVVEPALSTELVLAGPLSAGMGLGYRWVRGAGQLFLVEDGDLHGLHGFLFVRLGG